MLNKFLLLGLLGLLSLVFLLDAVAFGQDERKPPRISDEGMGWLVDTAFALERAGEYKSAAYQWKLVAVELTQRRDSLQARNKALEVQIDALEQRNRNLYGAGIAVLSVAVLLIGCWIWDKRRKRAKSFEEKERPPC